MPEGAGVCMKKRRAVFTALRRSSKGMDLSCDVRLSFGYCFTLSRIASSMVRSMYSPSGMSS